MTWICISLIQISKEESTISVSIKTRSGRERKVTHIVGYIKARDA